VKYQAIVAAVQWSACSKCRTEILVHLNYYSFSWYCIHTQLFRFWWQTRITTATRCGI